MTDSELLLELINRAVEDIEHAEIEISGLAPENEALGEAVCSCLIKMREVTRFTASMADGDMALPVPKRDNYLAGPIKDLYYKFMHLKWQTNQIAKGDYSQHVDFMGDFADAFNAMTEGLKSREDTIRLQAEEKLRMKEKEKLRLERQMDRQRAHFLAYQEYTESFQRFRVQYKQMMSEVYVLFNEGKYEEGRRRIAYINDMMGSNVEIRMNYSNRESVNTALNDISAFCRQHCIGFSGTIHVPDGYADDKAFTPVSLSHLMDLVFLILESTDAPGRRIDIRSIKKADWLSIMIQYDYASGERPSDSDPDIAEAIATVSDDASQLDAMFDYRYHDNPAEFVLMLHLPKNRAGTDR